MRSRRVVRKLVWPLSSHWIWAPASSAPTPGLVLGLVSPELDRFTNTVRTVLSDRPSSTMLTLGIHHAYQSGVARLSEIGTVKQIAQGVRAAGGCQAVPTFFTTTAEAFMAAPILSDEIFGPASLLVVCKDMDQMLDLARRLEGQLTATLQMDELDTASARRLLPVLERKVGRILANGFPTGVEVSHAMVHGGPFPSTTDGRSTSVGSAAIDRFLRSVSYQNIPPSLLPVALKSENTWAVPRRVDGVME